MRRSRKACALALVAVFGLVLALCLLPTGAVAEVIGATTTAGEPVGSSSATSSGDSQAGSSEASGGDATGEAASSASDGGAASSDDASSNGAAAADDEGAASEDAPVEPASGGSGTVQIQYDKDTDIHYVPDANSANGRIILYCMNNKSHWPHVGGSIGTIPDYSLGYLTPDKFKAKYPDTYQQAYQECMNKLLAILYAGYPYNGMNMYTVVDSTQGISEDAFNALLNPPSWIRSDFPDSIGDTVFSYSDYPDNKANLGKLSQFVTDELTKYYSTGAKTPSGHTSADIRATPFYQAAIAMAYAPWYNETPLKVYDKNHSDANAVTEAQAYEATQYAIWAVLGDYGIENNSLTSKSGEVTQKALAVKLLDSASADKVLRAKPDEANVTISGDAQFVYDPEYGLWKTGTLKVGEGENYHGTYALTLPAGVSAHALDGTPLTTVSAGTPFFLASTSRPTSTDMSVEASDTLTWLEEYRQYSPSPENYKAYDGKTFQHMIGAVIKQKTVKASLSLAPAKEGSLKLTKTVTGEQSSTASFEFTVKLTGEGSGISGKYGDLTFDAGTAKVSLQAGQSATAEHLPAGVGYTVTEEKSEDYSTTSEGETGTIVDGGTATAAFTNARLYKLTLAKTVSGQAADSSQDCTLDVTLKDSSGKALTGTYSYTGGTVAGSAATAPADGTIALDAGGKGSVTLKPGQTVTIKGLPSGASYEVEEAASTVTDEPLYDATYDGSATPASGTLSADATVTVNNAVQEGKLSVTKHVKGEVGSKQPFTFTVTLGGSGAHLTGTYGEMEFSDGKANFTLTDGETKTASALPAGATYEVSEESNSDYVTSSENDKGQITKGGTAEVSFTNTRGAVTLPLSGQSGLGATFAVGAALLAAAALWAHTRRGDAGKGGDGRD